MNHTKSHVWQPNHGRPPGFSGRARHIGPEKGSSVWISKTSQPTTFWRTLGLIAIMFFEAEYPVSQLDPSRPNRKLISSRGFVIAFTIFVLIASLTTRTSVPTGLHGITAQSVSAQATRQHLDGDAFQWVAPVPVLTALQAPSFYPRFSPGGPPLPNLLFDESLYNRPPPSC